MHPFRTETPKRRLNRAECIHYESYRKTLREDFLNRCGYCGDSDEFRIRSFTIDHFVPQNPKDFTHTIAPNFYYNLVYSCGYCNSSKTNKWPLNDPAIHNDGSIGFMEPTEDEYTIFYSRDHEGKIFPTNPANVLATHIIEELQLWLPIHHKMWKIERLNKLHIELQDKINSVADTQLKEQLKAAHYELLKDIQSIQESIFTENK